MELFMLVLIKMPTKAGQSFCIIADKKARRVCKEEQKSLAVTDRVSASPELFTCMYVQ